MIVNVNVYKELGNKDSALYRASFKYVHSIDVITKRSCCLVDYHQRAMGFIHDIIDIDYINDDEVEIYTDVVGGN